MSYRQTSAQAYHQIKEEGLLSKRRLQVYSIIADHGPINCRGIINIAARGQVTNTGAISGRLSELEKMRVITEAFRDKCPITGHQTAMWMITNRLPVKIEKPDLQTCPTCDGHGKIPKEKE